MDRREAIDILVGMIADNKKYNLSPTCEEENEALDLAIEALLGDMYCPSCGVRLVPENEYVEPKERTETHACDCISRQEAIEAMRNINTIVRPISESDDELLIDRTDALIILENFPPVTQTASEDCISRADLLNTINAYVTGSQQVEHIKSIIKDAPSVTPTDRAGEWIPVTKVYRTTEADFPETHIEWETATEPDEIDAVRCSKCGEVFDFESARNWCTECGAKMEK